MKKTAVTEYSRPKSGGIIGISLEEGDTLIDVALTQPGDEVVLCTRNGMAIRFDEADARPWAAIPAASRASTCATAMRSSAWWSPIREGSLLTVCENGYGKRTPFGPTRPASR